jgi:hypothetical protein
MAARKKTRSAARKKKTAAQKKTARQRSSTRKGAKKPTAGKTAGKTAKPRAVRSKAVPKGAGGPSHPDPLRDIARSFAARHIR